MIRRRRGRSEKRKKWEEVGRSEEKEEEVREGEGGDREQREKVS